MKIEIEGDEWVVLWAALTIIALGYFLAGCDPSKPVTKHSTPETTHRP